MTFHDSTSRHLILLYFLVHMHNYVTTNLSEINSNSEDFFGIQIETNALNSETNANWARVI